MVSADQPIQAIDQPMGMFGTVLYLWHHWGEIKDQWSLVVQAFIGLVGLLTTLASIITPLTTTPKDDAALAWLKNWMHQIAFTNAKDVKGIGQEANLSAEVKPQTVIAAEKAEPTPTQPPAGIPNDHIQK